jgi:predicted  nucleic acid-binding Zn-ribbon protein
MTLAELKDWVSVIGAGGTIVLGLAFLWLRANFATLSYVEKQRAEVAGQLKVLKGDVDGVETRIAKVESALDHLPDKDITHRLEIAVTELRGELKAMAEAMKPVAHTSQRLEQFLLDQAGK